MAGLLDRLHRVPVLGTALRVQERYTADAADALAASIGFFGFLSLFPLLALVLSGVGFVLRDDPAAVERTKDAVVESIPAFAALAGGDNGVSAALDSIQGSPGSLLGLGTVFLLLAGLRIAAGVQQASVVVFRVERPSGLRARVGQLGALAAVGTLALAGATVGGSVGIDLGNGVEGVASSFGLIALTFAIDTVVFLVAYRVFTPGAGPPWHVLLPGSLLAGAGWVALKLFGTSYVTRQASTADESFGALGAVIALLLLFYLAGRLYVYGAELAALLAHVDDEPVAATEAGPFPPVARHPVALHPVASPAPARDEAPTPGALGGLALTAVTVAAVGAALDRILRR